MADQLFVDDARWPYGITPWRVVLSPLAAELGYERISGMPVPNKPKPKPKPKQGSLNKIRATDPAAKFAVPTKMRGLSTAAPALDAVTVAEVARPLPGSPHDEYSDRAQDLVYQAWESQGADRLLLARQAIDIDPDCADAYTILAEAVPAEEAIPLYQRGVEAGQRTLGPVPFAEYVGHFWGLFETRPYMRARAGLGEALWATGVRQEALAHFLELLRLNESDNQGIRYVALPRLLENDQDEQARELLDRFADDASAQWAWLRALITFRRDGATERAELELQRARTTNLGVAKYLTGSKPIPAVLPSFMGFGDDNEAMVCAAEQLQAWRCTPGAIPWLLELTGVG